MQQENDRKHTANKGLYLGEKVESSSQSPDLNPIEHAFHLPNRRLRGNTPPYPKKKTQQKEAAVKDRKSIIYLLSFPYSVPILLLT